MTRIKHFDAHLLRPQDGWPLGAVSRSMGINNPNATARRFLPQGYPEQREFPTLDAAALWVEANPNVPDLTQTPEHNRVYGPLLLDMDGYALMGHVWSRVEHVAPGMGFMDILQHAPFVVVSPAGQIMAKITRSGGTWTIKRHDHGQAKTLTRKRSTLHDALHLLVREVSQSIPSLSGHARMHLLQQVPDVTVRAEVFLEQRDAQVARLLSPLGQIPDKEPVRADIYTFEVVRYDDNFVLGTITRQDDGYSVDRHGLRDGAGGPMDGCILDSLESALEFLRSSPHAPDLNRFPFQFMNCIYGSHLWTLPEATVIGRVSGANTYTHDPDCKLAIHRPRPHQGGTMCWHPATRLWELEMQNADRTTSTFEHADLLVVLEELCASLMRLHAGEHHDALRAQAPDALVRMIAFIDTFDEHVHAFEQGTPAG